MKIEIKSLSKKYFNNKNKALDNVNAEIPSGVFGLLGENGAGKTSLIKTLATIMAIQEGSILMDDQELSEEFHKIRKIIGYLPQKLDFFERLTVYEMLDYIALLKNVTNEYRDRLIRQLVTTFNLDDKVNCKIKDLSGGMKQRVAIAQALIGEPKLIILDEPTVGLDPNERLRFRNIINEIKENRTIIISTHIISDIAMLCNQMGIMKNGKMIYCGSINDLLESIEGKVFVDTLNINENIDKTKYGNIISVTRGKNSVIVRFILNSYNNKGYKSATPTLEDAYFYWTSLEEGKTNDKTD